MASAWHEGRRAWKRLDAWQGATGKADPDGAGALEALTDLGAIRRLLDRAELEGVRAARGRGRSWAEIATRLGVTRQSAWERWRDLDQDTAPDGAEDAGPVPASPDVAGPVEMVVIEQAANEGIANAQRRRGKVRVPVVVGLSLPAARGLLAVAGLTAYASDPDGQPLSPAEWESGLVVADQSPESGARVPSGSPIRLWVDRGSGGAGVREPRRPSPDPLAAREALSAQPKVNE